MKITTVLSLVAAAGLTQAAAGQTLTTTRVISGLSRPVWVGHAPGDPTRLFVLEQWVGNQGRMRVFDLTTNTLIATPALTRTVSTGNEQGLLGLAFHPEFQDNNLFYINYTNPAGTTIVEEWELVGNSATGGDVIFTQSQPQSNHNGGWMQFGPDGYLYIALGDGGGANDSGTGHDPTRGNGQFLGTNLGKMLRIDVNDDDFPADPNKDYAIPDDNPFDAVGDGANDEIWARGLRNPWRNDFDNLTGDLYIADVGQNNIEEINFQPASSAGGENYGWRCYEGNNAFNLNNCDAAGTMVFPIHTYTHAQGCSVTGGAVYRGCAIPNLSGTYFFADYCFNTIWSFRWNGSAVTEFTNRTAQLDPPGTLSITSVVSFGEDFYGEVYIVDQNGGEVFKIISAVAPPDADGDGQPDTCEFPCSAADLSGSDDPNNPGYGIPDQEVDSADFFYFLDQFEHGNLAIGDVSGSSDPNDAAYGVPDGALDSSDFFYFLDVFVVGCT